MFNLPNILTLANLICGCMAINAVYAGDAKKLLMFFSMSLVFDLLDGLVARALNQSSPLGRELDSLADMVSFGVLPGVIFFLLLAQLSDEQMLIPSVFGFVFTAAAALRLAKFNLDDRQTKDFLGLNTPAATIAVVGLYVNEQLFSCAKIATASTSNVVAILMTVFIMSSLLLIDLPMLSFKFDRQDRRRLIVQGFLILGGVIILLLMQTCALPFLILWYIIYSIIRFIIEKYSS